MVGLFEQRAVGFIDILGFKQLMDEAEASEAGFQRLAGLRAVLDNFVLYDNDGTVRTVPDALKPRYIFVSDSIILSAPLRHDRRDLADGLSIVVLKTIQIAERIIELGHLCEEGSLLVISGMMSEIFLVPDTPVPTRQSNVQSVRA